MVVGFESDVGAPLCCSLLHNDAIVGKESEDDVEYLLIITLNLRIIYIRNVGVPEPNLVMVYILKKALSRVHARQ